VAKLRQIEVLLSQGKTVPLDCKEAGNIALDRSSYPYEPRSDHNVGLRQELVNLARQKPRYGYGRLHALVTKRGFKASAQRGYRLYRAEGLMVRRLKRKRLARVAVASHLVRSNQEWALDFVSDSLATGQGIRVLTVVDAFTRENLSLEVDVSLSSRRVTRALEAVVERRGKPDPGHINTSYIERQNLTMRMFMRRFTRLTNGFSKKIENHSASVALYMMYYNFGRKHATLGTTPAVKAGVADHIWSVEEIIGLLEKSKPKATRPAKTAVSN
jgi:transposase InsO family protein